MKDTALSDLALLRKVVAFKEKFYNTAWARLSEANPGTFLLVPPDARLPALRQDYLAMRQMLMGIAPEFDEMMRNLTALQDEINGR